MNANSFLQLSIVLTWGCNLLLALTALRINRMKRQREQLAPGIRGGIERDAINGRINRAYRGRAFIALFQPYNPDTPFFIGTCHPK